MNAGATKPRVFHIPICPFSQRLEILLSLKGIRDAVDFEVVDITKPRADWLLAKTGGRTPLPVMELEDGTVLRESLVLLQYLEDRFPNPPVAKRDPRQRAIESLFVAAHDRDFASAGYTLLMNQDRERRAALTDQFLGCYASMDRFLRAHATGDAFLFDGFGWVETVFTSIMMRLWCLDYYEHLDLPREGFERVRAFREACLAHPAAQQVCREQIVKSYYDYAKNVGNGALAPGRARSSFVFEPDWSKRPWPPEDKYGTSATDEQLGLL